MNHIAHVRWHTRPGKNKQPKLMTMVCLKSYGIPKLRGNLPLIYKPRFIAIQKQSGIKICQLDILRQLSWLRHIEHTFGNLLSSSSLTAPFGPFKKNCAFSFKFPHKQLIGHSRSIFFFFSHIN